MWAERGMLTPGCTSPLTVSQGRERQERGPAGVDMERKRTDACSVSQRPPQMRRGGTIPKGEGGKNGQHQLRVKDRRTNELLPGKAAGTLAIGSQRRPTSHLGHSDNYTLLGGDCRGRTLPSKGRSDSLLAPTTTVFTFLCYCKVVITYVYIYLFQ